MANMLKRDKRRRRRNQATGASNPSLGKTFVSALLVLTLSTMSFSPAIADPVDPSAATPTADTTNNAPAQNDNQPAADEGSETPAGGESQDQPESPAADDPASDDPGQQTPEQPAEPSDEPAASGEASSSASSASAASSSDSAASSESSSAASPASEEATEKTIEASIGSSTGGHFTVKVKYGKDAAIPDGTQVKIVEYVQAPEPEHWREPAETESFVSKEYLANRTAVLAKCLGMPEDGMVFYSKFLHIALVHDGHEIAPQVPVEITVESTAVDIACADAMELAQVVYDEAVANNPQLVQDGYVASDGTTARAAGANDLTYEVDAQTNRRPADDKFMRYRFASKEFGEYALAGIVAPKAVVWQDETHAAQVLGPMPSGVEAYDSGAEGLPEGEELLGAYAFGTNPGRDYGTMLWTRVVPTAAEGASLSSPILGYVLQGGAVAGGATAFKDAGVTLPFKSQDGLALARKSAANANANQPEANNVPVAPADTEGVLISHLPASKGGTYVVKLTYGPESGIPEGSSLQVRELSGLELAGCSAQTMQALPDEQVTSVRALDITVRDAAGNKIEPEGTVGVSITLANAVASGQAQVVHFADEGTEVITPQQSTAAATGRGSWAGSRTLDFATDDFSVFAIAFVVKEAELVASDGNTYKVTVSYGPQAGIPENAQLVVREIKQGDEGYEEYVAKAAAKLGEVEKAPQFATPLDITLMNPETGETYQPREDVKVSVELLNNNLSDYKDVNVIHVHGSANEQVEIMESDMSGDAVEFMTSGFSVYVITGGGATVTPRCTYSFYVWNEEVHGYSEYGLGVDDGSTTYTQTIKTGDKLVVPQLESTDAHVFAGWYEGNIVDGQLVLADKPYDFDNIEITENGDISLYAVYKDFVNVVFHDQYDSDTKSFPVVATRSAALVNTVDEGGDPIVAATVKIDDVSATYISNDDKEMAFYGWSFTPITTPGADKDDEGHDVEKITSDSITMSEPATVHLYPIFKNAHWLTFYSAQSGLSASYVPPARVFEGENVATPLPTASRNGYTFLGWYAGNLVPTTVEGKTVETVEYGSQIADENGKLSGDKHEGSIDISDGKLYLTGDATLYAKWQSSYNIVYWKQVTTEQPGITDPHFEYAETVTHSANIGDTVSVSEAEKAYDRYFGYYFSHCDEAKTIGDTKEITTLNVYYVLGGVYSGGGQHTLTFADSVKDAGQQSPMPPAVVGVDYKDQLKNHKPNDPASSRKSENERDVYEFAGWFYDQQCTIPVDFSKDTMPDRDLTVYAGWQGIKYRVQIDPNYGALYGIDGMTGTGSTWFNNTYADEPIGEYTHVTRDYVESSSGEYYYVKHDYAYYGGNPPSGADRKAYYTKNPGLATEDTTFEYAPGIYAYAGWYEVVNGVDAAQPYDFSQHTDHPTTLKLHWKKKGSYYLAYEAGEGAMEGGAKEVISPEAYSDHAEIALSRAATAPEGFTFVGWKVHDDESGLYYGPGQAFTLHADDAIRVSGKEIVYLDAVYARVGTARIVYNANGGAINPSELDVTGAVDTAAGTVTVSGLTNNEPYALSTGAGFVKEGAEFLGWSNMPVYDENDPNAKFYKAGDTNTYGVDTNEPVTLYAVWGVKVTYHLNGPNQSAATWGGAGPGDTWAAPYVKETVGGETVHTQTVVIGNAVSEPSYIPQCDEPYMFNNWRTSAKNAGVAQDNSDVYDFTEPVEGALHLYAYWSGPVDVAIHAVDASSSSLQSVDSWLKATTVKVGVQEISLDESTYVTVPAGEGYDFAFAAIHNGDIQSISEDKAVEALYYNSEKKQVYAKLANGAETALKNGDSVYFVYYKEKQLDIKYQSMGVAGTQDLTGAVAAAAPKKTGMLGNGDSFDMQNSVTSPMAWVNNSAYGYFAYAIGDAGAGMRYITSTSSSDASLPTLQVRNTWRGFQYSTDGSVWTDCGYSSQLYVLYFESRPNEITVSEQTVGTSSLVNNESFNYKVEIRGSANPEAVQPLQSFTFALKSGETRTVTAYWAQGSQQIVTVEQISNPGDAYDTSVEATQGEVASDAPKWTYTTTDGSGPVEVAFSNTHKALPVEVHVAMVTEDGIVVDDSNYRAKIIEDYSFTLPLGDSKSLQAVLPPMGENGVFIGDANTYAFGTALSGSVTTGTNRVAVDDMDVATVAYVHSEGAAGNVYELSLKDSQGNVLGELGSNAIYYLYYPTPKIKYMKQEANGALTDISGSTRNEATQEILPLLDAISYNHEPISMNGKLVEQNENLEISLGGTLVSQEGSDAFRMPPALDDGVLGRYLGYTRIGAGKAGITSINDSNLSTSDDRIMHLRINDEKLQYSFDEQQWTDLALADTPTIYAIYTERGYDFQISKTISVPTTGFVGDPTFFTSNTFDVTISSLSITEDSYEAEGAESTIVRADPSDGTNPGTIRLKVTDGTRVKIKRLGYGEYTITESGNENFNLTAKAGSLNSGTTSDPGVTDNSTITLPLTMATRLDLTNNPKPLCKINDAGTDHVFYTFASAIDYVENNIASYTATIEMLTDYVVPADDQLQVPEELDITLKTADQGFAGAGALATITRSQKTADKPLFINRGNLTLTNILVEGANIEATAPVIQSEGNLTIGSGAKVEKAKNTNNGGAISATAGNVAINGGIISECRASNGGAVYYSGNGNISLTGAGALQNNVATTGDGGAICATGGKIDIDGGLLSIIDGNTASNGRGGAIYAANTLMTLGGNGAVSGNSAKEGGAVYVASGSVKVADSVRITDNAATDGNGGAIWIGEGSVSVEGGSLTKNTSSAGNGGAIYANAATVSVLDGVIGQEGNANSALNGGAIYANTGAVSISGGTIAYNSATTGNGGAIYASAGEVNVSGGSMTHNAATAGSGGAVYASSGNVIVTAVNLGENNAAQSGGAIYADKGSVSISNSTLSQNTAGLSGGAIYADKGAVSVTAGSMAGNTATTGNGGALFVGSGMLTATNANMTGNNAVNGAAIFVRDGRAYYNGGSYTANTASEGGAVGFGSTSAKLFFSGDVQITNNKLLSGGSEVASNIYLDQDADDVLNMEGLGTGANLGIYVPDALTNARDMPGAKFATYSSDSNIDKISNDRYDFTVVKQESSKKLFWGKAIRVEVRYQASYANLPPNASATQKKYIDNYYPISGNAATSELAEDIYNNYNLGLTDTAAFGGSWAWREHMSYDDYVTRLKWDSSDAAWKIVKHDGSEEELGDHRLYIYYAEPAYISIENNTDKPLDISSLTVHGRSVINSADVAGYGMVFAKNGAIRTALLPVSEEDLNLAVGSSINLLIPGGRNMTYELGGQFSPDISQDARLRRTNGSSMTEETVPVDEARNGFTLTGATLNSKGTYQIIFGEDKQICKITDEHRFTKISDAVQYAKDNNLKTVTIEMLTDYLLPASDAVKIPKGYAVTLTTATSGEYQYLPAKPGEPRATISRDSENTTSMIETETGDVNSSLTLENLIIDGKSVKGTSNGGAVRATFFKVTARNVDFVNVIALNGGALFVDDYNNSARGTSNSVLEAYDCRFVKCSSAKGTDSRQGGGAIHAFTDTLTLERCAFDTCDAYDQAGAVFHRVDGNYNSWTTVNECTFTNCTARAAGAMELDSKTINVTNCTFEHCKATDRNGGGFNVYALNSANPTADCWATISGCTFNDCHATNSGGGDRYGGGFRSTSVYTTVTNCEFVNTSGKRGGAIGISSTNAKTALIQGCTINGCSSFEYGGGIYCTAKSLTIDDYDDGSGNPKSTTIQNCTAGTQGGGVAHFKNGDLDSFTMKNATVSGNVSSGNYGGGINTAAKIVSIEGSTISNNTAALGGGGVYTDKSVSGSAFSLTGSSITGNKVSGGNGGGICTKARTVTADGSTVSSNTSSGDGGGIWFDTGNDGVRDASSLLVRGCTVSDNSSGGNGGGIYAFTKTMTIQNDDSGRGTIVSGNTSAKTGGGVYQTRNVSGSKLEVTGATITGNKANGSGDFGLGGGVYANVYTVSFSAGCEVSGNFANISGGGIYSGSQGNDRNLILDQTTVSGNSANFQGGGVFSKSQVTLRNNAQVTGNRLSSTIVGNAAGIYLLNDRTFFIGTEGAAELDPSSVTGNQTAAGAPSNLRLWSNNDGQNNAQSIYVYCGLSGEVGVVNANKVGTKFGSSISPDFTGFSDDNYVFKADTSTLHGIYDRSVSPKTSIIWAGPPIAKITDGAGNLLFLKANEAGDAGIEPAIFDRLDSGNNGGYSTVGAFNMLRTETPVLFNADGTPYTGKSFCVKMLVERFETNGDIQVNYYAGRTVMFTTAGKDDGDDYPYTGKADRATVVRGSGVNTNKTLVNVNGNLTLQGIIIDGGAENGIAPGPSIRVMYLGDDRAVVTLGANATLQNGNTTDVGGGVKVVKGAFNISGGVIRNCMAADGGAVYKAGGQVLSFTAGNIYQCTATNRGGGVYLAGGTFNMSRGTISGGTAQYGAGVYIVNNNKVPFNMSGGSIINNNATVAGGGIAVEGSYSRIYFSNKPNVSGNTCDTSLAPNNACNVRLDQNTEQVINTNNGGLSPGASIGVYVPDDNGLYDRRGTEKKDFGTFANGDNTANLYSFVNDRNGLKGGIIEDAQPNTIYWIQIFALQVGKEVQVANGTEINPDEEFSFRVDIWGTATAAGQKNAGEIDSSTGEYGEMEFHSNGTATSATFTLKPGETVTGVNLSQGLYYSVTEILTEEQAAQYAAMPSTVVTGQVGENKDRTDIDPYTSVVEMVNVEPICKVTSNSGQMLYRRYTMGTGTSAKTFNVPAVFTELTGENGALTALDGTLYNGPDVESSTSYDTSAGVQVQMLVSNYNLAEGVSFGAGKKLTLTTAAADDAQFPYRGAGTTSTIKRSFQDSSMITLNAGSDLTLGAINLDGAKASYTVNADGGVVNVSSGSNLAIQDGAMLQNSRSGQKGGAVYVASGGVVAMTGGTIQRNESVGDGSGVYLEEGSTLRLSGNLDFGGKGTNIADNIVVSTGNYKDGDLDLANGGKEYTRARQDIFIAGYEDEDAKSLNVNGAITSSDGTIWVWAEKNPHYLQENQFARVVDTNNPGNLAAFRNAQDDGTAENQTGTYLYGVQGDGDSIVWSGVPGAHPVVLQKVNAGRESLSGAEFTIFRGNSTTPYVVKHKNGTTETLAGLLSKSNGTIWVGELPYGTYCMLETAAPEGYGSNVNKWFVLVVSDSDAVITGTAWSRPRV